MCMGKVPEKTRSSFQKSSPSGVTQDVSNSSSIKVLQHTWIIVYQEILLATQYSRNLLVAGQIGTFCLVSTKIPDSQKKSWHSINHFDFIYIYIYLKSLGIVSHSFYLGKVLFQCRELLPFIQVTDTNQGSTLQAWLSEDESLRPAILTLFCTISLLQFQTPFF